MKGRSVEILQNLFLSENPEYSIRDFSQKYGVSERSIYNDINEINEVLYSMDLKKIHTDNAGSIVIDPSTNTAKILQYLKTINTYEYHLSAKERRLLLLLKLLSSDTPLTVHQLTQLLFVSRTTIYYDLNQLKERISKFEAMISFSSDTGIFILCDEKQTRNLIADVLVHAIGQINNLTTFQQMLLNEVARSISLESIAEITHIAELTVSSSLTEYSFTKVCLNLFIAANRYVRGKCLTQFAAGDDFIENNIEYKFTSFIFKELGIISIAEIQSMTQDLMTHQIFTEKPSAFMIDLYTVIADFLYKISNVVGVPLCNETESFAFLVNHFENMMNSGRTNTSALCTSSPQKKHDFAGQYSIIFDAVKRNILYLEDYFHHTYSEDDIFYITMHICAAYERNLVKKPKLNICIIAPGSMATAQMLAAQIESRFNLRVQGAFDRSKINKLVFEQIDFIISTQKLPDIQIPTVVVNSILNINDYEKILTMTNKIYRQMKPASNEVSTGVNFLHSLTDPSRLCLNASASSWEEAIRTGGQLLLEHGDITESYITAMINTLQEFGPYYSVMPHLVFAHSAPKSGALNSGLSLVIYKNGVPFGLEEHDPIHLLFTVSERDSKKYLETFTKVISIAKDPKTWEQLMNAKSEMEIYQILIHA